MLGRSEAQVAKRPRSNGRLPRVAGPSAQTPPHHWRPAWPASLRPPVMLAVKIGVTARGVMPAVNSV